MKESERKSKHVRDSWLLNQRRKVRYEYLNSAGKMHGGNIYIIMDELAASVAEAHAAGMALTRMDVGGFKKQIVPSDSLVLYGYICDVGTSSMDITVQAYKIVRDEAGTEKFVLAAQRNLVFVALDEEGRPIEVPSLMPENDAERERMQRAKRRKELLKELETLMDPPLIPQEE
jgi:acyl-CoA hydrolase